MSSCHLLFGLQAAREPPGSSGSGHGWGLLWWWASKSPWFHSLWEGLFPLLCHPYSSLIPFVIISLHSTSQSWFPPVHGPASVPCSSNIPFKPIDPSSYCLLLSPPIIPLLGTRSVHILFPIPPFHLFFFSLQLAFYPHCSTQTLLTKDPAPTML